MKIRSNPRPVPTQSPPERTMGNEEFAQWLSQRPSAWGQNLSIIDGFITAVVVGPVSMHPLKWICPLIGIEPEAFNTGGTPEFAAIKAAMQWHNTISDNLVNGPGLEPVFTADAKGQVKAHDWCAGFMLAVDMNRRRWSDVLKTTSPHRRLMMPILIHLPVRVEGKDVTLDEESILADWRSDIPENAARLREIFQLKRYGTPHPNALRD
jgi:uncharacterized protein